MKGAASAVRSRLRQASPAYFKALAPDATLADASRLLRVGFNVFVLAMLALDLGVFHRKAHVVSFKESVAWTVVWVTLALFFNLGVWHYYGSEKALEFDTLVSLGVIMLILAISIVASLLRPKRPVHFAGSSGPEVLRHSGTLAGANDRRAEAQHTSPEL